ncbi:phosphoglycerate dehydrogenase [uncultured Eubacterium sp.]|uniref:phosphoglycerate dehydrogenase n=1 Tax=uncultured Eubacterium sp. TaxID=165185 RepID=UPI002671879B|nr:phosphoglycerate dehydrogenase [uncultured Eubacterium sp.]
MTKVNCLNPISNLGTDLLNDNYEMTDNFAEADVALVRSAAMHDLDLPESLMAVARAGAGVNNIPLDKCAEKGIVVFNTPGANANGVKELVLCGMLLASRDIIGGNKWVDDNKSDENINKTMEKAKKNFAGNEIKGKKLGVIGLGAIGRLVANMAVSMGMEVYGTDPFLSVESALSLKRAVNLVKTREEIFKTCDFITVHTPLLDDTREMINKDTIAMMKDGVVVLNFARDLLVCDDDMAEALKTGKVKKYVTDFPNAKTANMEGVIATPHLGASTEESEDNCAVMAVNEIMDFVDNGNIVNSVNYPNATLGVCDKAARITVCHKNIPNMIGQLTSVVAAENINVADMVDKSKGDFAYAIMDLDHSATEALVQKLSAVEGVIKVRVVK